LKLKVLLPFQVFAEKDGVKRIVAETQQGSFGILPHRLDCVAALVPGILTYETEAEGEAYIAIDEGVLVKTGAEVLVSVRNAVLGRVLGKLRETVDRQFLNLDEREKNARAVLAKLETKLVRHLLEFRHE
jgi:F-type H+-transporting ATPase subunit epsilon